MKSCGLIVEYNPYHNGHHYHFQQAKEITGADCVIAVMSGNFLQRGEPALIDKFSRARIAVEQGIDLVVELPYFYAVQHSELFAKGAIRILDSLQTDAVCFGSEHGQIDEFQQLYQTIQHHHQEYQESLKDSLQQGHSYPKANEIAFYQVSNQQVALDFTKPNNILGFQYVKNIYDLDSSITPVTIERIKNDYHDLDIQHPIASATSIRQALLYQEEGSIEEAVPSYTNDVIAQYKKTHGTWHHWQVYFPLLKYRVLTMTISELQAIHGVKEGIENRIVETAKAASTFQEWMELLKTKRYTWTSLQRIFTHILTNSQKSEIENLLTDHHPKGFRILAMSKKGKEYLRYKKKSIEIPWYTSNKPPYPYQLIDERVDHAYYSILPMHSQQQLAKQPYLRPIIKDA
ncbi:nucleotidyltransferase [Gracilibacillus caseinilyticus]|uniref:tRNA(Met) cytidine acetate ligase n=1 Tax=Gracilibacillus caseinilyticus TaxID=2932256 RepID=A0ABY4EVR7_9BACI|nr:nucleotidyltransferase [Gracilibacillus caseinilyticus]UOQ47973.1 nucleotidyltransferase [Gracilibacillus caseinilyticus]